MNPIPPPPGPDDGPITARGVAVTWLRVLAAALVVSAVMAISGSFGSGVMKIAPRLIYWLTLTSVGVTMGVVIGVWLVPRRWYETRPGVAWIAIVLALWLPMTAVVGLGEAWMTHRAIDVGLFLRVGPSTLATTAAMTALAFMIRRRDPGETHAAAPGDAPAKFLRRLPAKLAGAKLWAVEAEDHYLRLHTSLGQDLILMRLGDAIAELEGIEGRAPIVHGGWPGGGEPRRTRGRPRRAGARRWRAGAGQPRLRQAVARRRLVLKARQSSAVWAQISMSSSMGAGMRAIPANFEPRCLATPWDARLPASMQ